MLADGFLRDTDNLINTKAVRNYPMAIISTKEKYPVTGYFSLVELTRFELVTF